MPEQASSKSELIQPTTADMIIVCASAPGFSDKAAEKNLDRNWNLLLQGPWAWMTFRNRPEPRMRGINLLIWGEPGIGKTQGMARSVRLIGRQLYKMDLSQKSPEELKGIPRVVKEGFFKRVLFTVDAPNRFLIALARDKRAVLAVDDLTNASQATQAAALGLVLDKVFEDGRGGTISINHVPCFAMANHGAAAALSELLAPVANRFAHWITNANEDAQLWWEKKDPIQVDISKAATIDYEWNALYSKAWTLCSAFTVANKGRLFERQPQDFAKEKDYAWCTPRSLEFAARCIAACEHFGVDDERILKGCIGDVAALKLITFRKTLALPTAAQVFAGEVNWRELNTSQRIILLHEAAKEAGDENQVGAVLAAIDSVREVSEGSDDLIVLGRDMLIQRARGVIHSRPMTRGMSRLVQGAFPEIFGVDAAARSAKPGIADGERATWHAPYPGPMADGWPVPTGNGLGPISKGGDRGLAA